jgi:hypothetical protein
MNSFQVVVGPRFKVTSEFPAWKQQSSTNTYLPAQDGVRVYHVPADGVPMYLVCEVAHIPPSQNSPKQPAVILALLMVTL